MWVRVAQRHPVNEPFSAPSLCIYPVCPCNDRDFYKSTTAAATLCRSVSLCALQRYPHLFTHTGCWFCVALSFLSSFRIKKTPHRGSLFFIFQPQQLQVCLKQSAQRWLCCFTGCLVSGQKQAEPINPHKAVVVSGSL